MGSEPTWPLPSDSRRVRVLLYISEGVILGAGGLLVAFRFAGAYLVDLRTGSLNPEITPFGAFTLLFFLFLTVRYVAIKRVAPPSEENPAAFQDWSDTRQWRWVVTVALPLSAVLVVGATVRWSWWEIIFLRSFDLLLLGTLLIGVLLYIYILHKMGM